MRFTGLQQMIERVPVTGDFAVNTANEAVMKGRLVGQLRPVVYTYIEQGAAEPQKHVAVGETHGRRKINNGQSREAAVAVVVGNAVTVSRLSCSCCSQTEG